jgi:hypothetical protein
MHVKQFVRASPEFVSRLAYSFSTRCTRAMAVDPSRTAEATRFRLP